MQVGGTLGERVMVTVIAQPGPPCIKQGNNGAVIEVEEDEEVALDCESKGGRPAADIDWNYGNIKVIEVRKKVVRMEDLQTDPGPEKKVHSKNPYQLAVEDKKTFKTTSTLRFRSKKDSTISCAAFSEKFPNKRTSKTLLVKLKYRPKVEMKFGQEDLKEGDDLDVECSVKAYPVNVTFKWFVDDVEEKGFEGDTFKIKKITKKLNKSNVKCLVENDVGKSEIVKSLNVKFEPEIIIQPATRKVKMGEEASFTCKANSNPEPTYIWVKGKLPSMSEVVGVGENLTIIAPEETEKDYICQVVSEGFPIISSLPAQLIIEREINISKARELKLFTPLSGTGTTKRPESKNSAENFIKVIKSLKKDYLAFQKRTKKYMKQSEKYFGYSSKFEKKYNIFKKKLRKSPKSF